MANFGKNNIFAVFLILLMLISACSLTGKSSTKNPTSIENIRVGTDGITLSFLPNAPPDIVHVEQGADEKTNVFEAVLEVRNKGAFPQPEDGVTAPSGMVFLSGYDSNIIKFDKNPPIEDITTKPLDGKSTINPNGGLYLVTFKGTVLSSNLNVDKYEPTLLATACYRYMTIAGPNVCIDPNPYSTVKEQKVCEVQGITLTNQGAPVAVTKIDEEAFATKTQFRITIKNVGAGDSIDSNKIEKCSPSSSEKLVRDDVDKVFLRGIKVGNAILTCGPFVSADGMPVNGAAGTIRLINNEGYVVCELPSKDYARDVKSAYISPFKIELSYGYRNTAQKKITIKKETGGLGTGSGGTPASSSVDSGLPSSESGQFSNPNNLVT